MIKRSKFIRLSVIGLVALTSASTQSCFTTVENRDEYTFKFADPGPDTNCYTSVPPVNSFENIKLRIALEEIYDLDQQMRSKEIGLIKNENDIKKNREIAESWQSVDSINREKVIEILDKYGWIGSSEIGEKANSAFWLIIQHSNLKIQEKYLPKMRRAVKENRAKSDELALLEDRVLSLQGKKQLFGSQLKIDSSTLRYKLSPIEDEINVNKRRKIVGLEPLEDYSKRWGIIYILPKKN